MLLEIISNLGHQLHLLLLLLSKVSCCGGLSELLLLLNLGHLLLPCGCLMLMLHAIDHLLSVCGAAVLHYLILLMVMFLNGLVNAWQRDAHVVRRLLL